MIEDSARFCNEKVKEIKGLKKMQYLETKLELPGLAQPGRKIIEEESGEEIIKKVVCTSLVAAPVPALTP